MDKATPAAKPDPIEEKAAAEQTYTLIHDALDAYAEHWSSWVKKADQAGISVTDAQGTNEYDFMETVKAIAWSYFLHETGRHLDHTLAQRGSKDIVSTLKRRDKVDSRRMSRISWDETAVKERQPLKQYFQAIACGAALEGFLLDHFQEGKILLDGLLKPLPQYNRGVSAAEYEKITKREILFERQNNGPWILLYGLAGGLVAFGLTEALPAYTYLPIAVALLAGAKNKAR